MTTIAEAIDQHRQSCAGSNAIRQGTLVTILLAVFAGLVGVGAYAAAGRIEADREREAIRTEVKLRAESQKDLKDALGELLNGQQDIRDRLSRIEGAPK